MGEDGLADSVVRVLSDYLQRKESGAGHYTAENLLALVEGQLSVGLPNTVYLAFRAEPGDKTAIAALKLCLAEAMRKEPGFSRSLTAALGDKAPHRPGLLRRRIQVSLAVLGVVVVAMVGTGFGIGRVSAPTAGPETITVTPLPPSTTTGTTTATTTTTTATSTSTSTSTGSPPTSGVPGDGSALPKGSPVYLADLPVPTGQSVFEHGDHDVQLTQYQNSLWSPLNPCNSDYTSDEQQFRLKNFTRLEVKSVGTDGTSDPSLTVKYEVFANDDQVHAIVTQVASPGQAQPLAVDLPTGVFALTLRVSLVTLDKKKCPRGNAVWGSPYVVAAGQ